MSLQNRVDPFGNLHAVPHRGKWMGNRGLLHNDRKEIVRHSQLKRWIYCKLEFKGWHREVMRPGHYTELFFLDEATALAAGHRPCMECQRERATEFKRIWNEVNLSGQWWKWTRFCGSLPDHTIYSQNPTKFLTGS